MADGPYELETHDGDILTFATEDEMFDFVIANMIERGGAIPFRDENDELNVKIPGHYDG